MASMKHVNIAQQIIPGDVVWRQEEMHGRPEPVSRDQEGRDES
jgi:hypothetical protein